MSLIFLAAGVLFFLKGREINKQFKQNNLTGRAKGEVVRIIEYYVQGRSFYKPEIKYTYSGIDILACPKIGSASLNLQIGEEVDIIYEQIYKRF